MTAQKSNHEIAKDYLANIESLALEDLADAMSYKWFRLNTLYCIKDKFGKKIRFQPNGEQESFYLGRHKRDIILKARQLGFTTMKMIMDLDECLFTPNFSAGCIAHNLEDAKDIFRNKIKYAYQNISDDQRQLIADLGYELPLPMSDKDNSYVFNNGSSIKVSVSYRGGTLQSLHVSEFGKICRKFPDKAKEIVTGAFEAVAVGNVITIESTAEGREGYFYDYCHDAEKIQRLNKKLTELDFKFHFFPWWKRAEYRVDGDYPSSLNTYFDELKAKHGIELDEQQKAWYAAKKRVLGDDIKREYPSTSKEAFEVSIQGAYYATQFTKIYNDGRICQGFDNKQAEVYTAWDLGVGDSTAIWFYQKVGTEIHLIDYYENSGEGLQHYMKVLRSKPYKYRYHYAPHDIDNRSFEMNAKSRKQLAAEGFDLDGDGKIYRINFQVVPKKGVDDGIEDARNLLDRCVFDQDTCAEGIVHLENYRKEWNEKRGCFADKPLHDSHSHGADAFRYLAIIENGRAVTAAAPRMG